MRVLALTALVGIGPFGFSLHLHAQQSVDELRGLAEQGSAEAQLGLGFIYATGRGVPQDDADAVRWWQLAADQEDAVAQYNLGVKYENGQGVAQDDVTAHVWFTLAIAGAFGEVRDAALQGRDEVARRMADDQVADTERRAREWTSTPER